MWQDWNSFQEQTAHEVPDVDADRWVSYSIGDLIPEWQDQAHCADQGHAMYFGDESKQPTMSIKQIRNAAKLCDVCPVYDECLRHALTVREEYGVWAGTSGRGRRRLFAMLDTGEWTVDEVIEVMSNERRGRVLPFRSDVARGSGVHDETPRADAY